MRAAGPSHPVWRRRAHRGARTGACTPGQTLGQNGRVSGREHRSAPRPGRSGNLRRSSARPGPSSHPRLSRPPGNTLGGTFPPPFWGKDEQLPGTEGSGESALFRRRQPRSATAPSGGRGVGPQAERASGKGHRVKAVRLRGVPRRSGGTELPRKRRWRDPRGSAP